jgi:cupin 2 domain-containing protein
MSITTANLLAGLPRPDTGERFDELLRCGNVRIERIVSSPQPEPVVYDQPQHEWVLLLEGSAVLEIAGKVVRLCAGDHVLIPAHCRHRLLSTSTQPRCLWLAVHIWPEGEPAAADGPVPAGTDG